MLQFPGNISISYGRLWLDTFTIHNISPRSCYDEREIHVRLFRILPTCPLRKTEHTPYWCIRGAFYISSESLLPQVPRCLHTALKVTRYRRSIFRHKFPPHFHEGKDNMMSSNMVQTYPELMPNGPPKFIPKIYGFKVFGMRGSRFELKFDSKGLPANEEEIR